MATSCSHLAALEDAIRAAGIGTQADGASWWTREDGTKPGANTGGGWVYFDCFLDRAALETRFGLTEPVYYESWDGMVAGHEAGFYCREHDSAVVGVIEKYRAGKPAFP